MKTQQKEQIENALAKLDAAKKALKKDTTPDTEKPTPTPETKVPAVGATTTVKGVKYAVTKVRSKGRNCTGSQSDRKRQEDHDRSNCEN